VLEFGLLTRGGARRPKQRSILHFCDLTAIISERFLSIAQFIRSVGTINKEMKRSKDQSDPISFKPAPR
jgi:hypothetical protein